MPALQTVPLPAVLINCEAMRPRYCYWSVCDGTYGALMEHCVRTARQAGVFKEFHVLTDRPLAGCECYDCFQFDKANGLFKLHYLKAGMSRLNFDYFVWLDADTVFVRNPVDVLGALGRSPIHIPLEANLSALKEDTEWKGVSLHKLRELMQQQGIVNEIYLCQSAFWMVHHDAIEPVYDLALGFWHKAKEGGLVVDVSAALGYALQMFCADPEAHRLKNNRDLWASDEKGCFRETLPDGTPWIWQHPVGLDPVEIRPAILHLPKSKHLLTVSMQ